MEVKKITMEINMNYYEFNYYDVLTYGTKLRREVLGVLIDRLSDTIMARTMAALARY